MRQSETARPATPPARATGSTRHRRSPEPWKWLCRNIPSADRAPKKCDCRGRVLKCGTMTLRRIQRRQCRRRRTSVRAKRYREIRRCRQPTTGTRLGPVTCGNAPRPCFVELPLRQALSVGVSARAGAEPRRPVVSLGSCVQTYPAATRVRLLTVCRQQSRRLRFTSRRTRCGISRRSCSARMPGRCARFRCSPGVAHRTKDLGMTCLVLRLRMCRGDTGYGSDFKTRKSSKFRIRASFLLCYCFEMARCSGRQLFLCCLPSSLATLAATRPKRLSQTAPRASWLYCIAGIQRACSYPVPGTVPGTPEDIPK